jgi:cellulose synthase/poly-beta-1,6-N-acetylglucosamine synthase-like glycosyltransferase
MPTSESNPAITFMVVVRDERRYIEKCLRAMLGQSLDPAEYEVLVIDSMSTDGTREVVERVMGEHPDRSIRLLDNPGLILSCGWNIGIREARGRYVARLDAHSDVPADFLERNLEVAEAQPKVGAVGGGVETIGEGFWGGVIARLLSSRIGVGGSTFRVGGQAGFVDAMAFGMYNRAALIEVGGLDEGLVVNQDNILHARLRAADRGLYFDPSIRSVYRCRDSLGALWRQMFRRAQWLILMLKHQKEQAFLIRYYVPMGFVLTILLLSTAGVRYPPAWWLLGGLLGVYVVVGLGAAASMRMPPTRIPAFPVAMFVLHFAYGLGEVVGALRYPFHRTNRNRSHPLRDSYSSQEAGRPG